MCGLAGFWSAGHLSQEDIHLHLPRMATALRHRGPDDDGFWSDAQAGIALCHRRLAIIELSALGAQPMHSSSGRYTVVFNGEIYNYRDLREELISRGHAFRGGSDTEVLLGAVETWGVGGAVERIVGMFAFALWDGRDRVLHLARDRFGEKPLYFGEYRGALLFGSELKALRGHPSWIDEIDRDALRLMMQHDYVPAPYSIFKHVRKVMPGSFITVRRVAKNLQIEEHRYWRPEEHFEAAARESSPMNAAECLDLVGATLQRAVERQMLAADVPVGAFLSGGTDSSLVVAMMQKIATRPVKTFSMGFADVAYDESPFARAVSEHLGTEHTEYTVTARDCLDVVPLLPHIYDEPFADSSQIPTYLVCKLARSAVTVALSGDAGDELFGGYTRYAVALSKWRSFQRLPAMVRAGGGALVERLPLGALELVAKPASLFWGRYGQHGLADKIQEQSSRLKATNIRDFYRTGMHRWPATCGLVLGEGFEPVRPDAAQGIQHVDELKQMMHADTCGYLPDDILVKVDRAAMAVSLETRIPMLDTDVVRAAWRVPSNVLRHDGRGKWVLRELLKRHVPAELVERPKKGFAVPMPQWLRSELRPWATDLLNPYGLRQEGFLDPSMVQRRWRQHLSGQADWSQHLWNVLMFQAWLAEWRASSTARGSQARAS